MNTNKERVKLSQRCSKGSRYSVAWHWVTPAAHTLQWLLTLTSWPLQQVLHSRSTKDTVSYTDLYLQIQQKRTKILTHMFRAGIAQSVETRYGLNGPRIESRCGLDFPHPSRPALGPTQTAVQWLPSFCPRGRATGAYRQPTTLSSAEIKERAELYLYCLSGASYLLLR